jgi:hypothetical protein
MFLAMPGRQIEVSRLGTVAARAGIEVEEFFY